MPTTYFTERGVLRRIFEWGCVYSNNWRTHTFHCLFTECWLHKNSLHIIWKSLRFTGYVTKFSFPRPRLVTISRSCGYGIFVQKLAISWQKGFCSTTTLELTRILIRMCSSGWLISQEVSDISAWRDGKCGSGRRNSSNGTSTLQQYSLVFSYAKNK